MNLIPEFKRTYASRIRFFYGPSIGDQIPPVLARTLEVSFNINEAKAYDRVYHPTVKRLAKYQDGQIIWNMGVFRKLVLLSKGYLLSALRCTWERPLRQIHRRRTSVISLRMLPSRKMIKHQRE